MTVGLSSKELAAIAARHARTTLGEWRFDAGEVSGLPFVATADDGSFGSYAVLFNVEWASDADAAFVAHAHQDIPRLLADLNSAQATIARMTVEHRAERLALSDDIEALHAAAGRRDAEIASNRIEHEDEVREIGRTIAGLREAISDREAAFARLAAEAEARAEAFAGEIVSLQVAVSERDAAAIRSRESHAARLQERDDEIADLRASMQDRDAASARLIAEDQALIGDLADEIEALREAVAERDALAAQTSDEYDRQTVELLDAIERFRIDVARQRARADERDGLIRELLFRYQPIFLCEICGRHGAPDLVHAPDCLVARASDLVGRSGRMRMIASSVEPQALPDVAVAAPLDEGLDIGEGLS